ncbi:MAG TPA: cytochrome c [Vicinamibacterales bacterium]|nr:cytochrome c [Vicinamibacterales bacterium]
MIRTLAKGIWHVLAMAGVFAIVTALWLWNSGIGTTTPPGRIETAVARVARTTMIPATARRLRNPEPAISEHIRSGLEHWADHCASCHANNGAGDTDMGRGLYPPAPDMRQAATQNLTDGELFYIIENGVKLTGMPAWGTGTEDSARSTWHLVHFIRRLPNLSEAEQAEMEELNPRSAAEWRALEEERRFLSGEVPVPSVEPSTHDHKGVPQ